MSKKVSITLDDEVLSFVDQLTSNRSHFINKILQREKQRIFLAELKAAYTDQSCDPESLSEVAVWDAVAGDALDA
jgi:23S rRNA U2552 (ribose-2'-O)-methylase RlmE/FtsJ